MTKVAPSILSGDFANMGATVANATAWGADYIHFDVMDGVFVPNLTFGMPMCKAVRAYTTLPLDVHLMIVEPEKYVEQFCDCGADIVTFHPDASHKVQEALDAIHAKGKKAGLVLNPDKGLEWIEPYWDSIDMLVIMGVYAGFGGQKFIPDTLAKMRAAHERIARCAHPVLLEVDGGVTEQNAAEMVACGVDVLVGGSSVFRSANPAQTIAVLRGEAQ